MTLPDFLGIGVQKGGTSWLHHQLVHHPQVFIPETRKEIHFFDWYFERGLNWYQKWFPDTQHDYKSIGEITPRYVYDDISRQNIKNTLPDTKFILILRNPVRRAYSHYQMTFQSGEGFNYKNFDEFMEKHDHGFKRGLYGAQLQKWFKDFNPDQFLILISEELSNTPTNLETTYQKLSAFLNIDNDKFNRNIANTRIGKARSIPRFVWLTKIIDKTRQKLKDWDMDYIAYGLKKLGITRALFASNKKVPPLTDAHYQKWIAAYQDDIKLLENLLNREFTDWR